MRFVNIACGNLFVLDKFRVNFDYASSHPSVKKANLSGRLPFKDDSMDVVYSSQFIEHILRHMLPLFFQECWRILKQGGRVRFVLPDLENLCREYLTCRENGEQEKANFEPIEIIDQWKGESFVYLEATK